MPNRTIPLFKVHMPKTVGPLLEEVLRSGFLNEGVQVAEFESQLRGFIGNTNTLALNSGTAGLTLSLHLSGVGPGAEVITSPMTCVATNTPIKTLFAKPIWCDINPQTGNIDHRCIEKLITPRTKAILFVDWAGVPADIEAIMSIGQRYNIKVIEDAAHAFGAEYSGKKVGTIADFTMFSFQAIKHLTTGDGGALCCKSETDFKRAKNLKWFGIDREATKDSAGNWKGSRWDCQIEEAGYKFHMNNIAGTIGIEQLKHIPSILAKHRKNAEYLRQALKNVPGITLPEVLPQSSPVWWVCMIFAERRDELSRKLTAMGVHNSLLHVRNDMYHCFNDSQVELPGVSLFESRELCLPCGWWVNDDDLLYIEQCIKSGW